MKKEIHIDEVEDKYIFDNGFGPRVYHCRNCGGHKLVAYHEGGGFVPQKYNCDGCGEKGISSPTWTTLKQGIITVKLASVGNPDFGQNPNEPLWGAEPDKEVQVKDLREASIVCREFISDNDLGSGNWVGGQVYEDGKQIARISYNSRVWKYEPEKKFTDPSIELIPPLTYEMMIEHNKKKKS